MKPNCNKKHDCIKIDMNWFLKSASMIDMMHCIESMLNNFFNSKSSIEKVTVSAAKYSFSINFKCSKLIEEFADEFHAIVTQGSFVCKRKRPDIQTAITFLCTKVKEPNMND